MNDFEFVSDGLNALAIKNFAKRNGKRKRVVIIGDTHFPFASKKVLKSIFEIIKDFKPEFIVQIGDLYDFYSASRFAKTLGLMTPQDEILQGFDDAKWMWNEVNKLSPQSKKVQLLGNHDNRVFKRVLEKSPELEMFLHIGIKGFYEFPGVEVIWDTQQEVVIDSVCYQHGYAKHGDHVKVNQMDSVHGHTHRPVVIYHAVRNEVFFELDVGFVADRSQVPLRYRQNTWNSWATGVGLIDENGPRVILLS